LLLKHAWHKRASKAKAPKKKTGLLISMDMHRKARFFGLFFGFFPVVFVNIGC